MSWPTTDDPRTEFVTVRFTAAEVADIEAYRQSGNFQSRSAALRNCADRVIAAEKKRKKRQKGGD